MFISNRTWNGGAQTTYHVHEVFVLTVHRKLNAKLKFGYISSPHTIRIYYTQTKLRNREKDREREKDKHTEHTLTVVHTVVLCIVTRW